MVGIERMKQLNEGENPQGQRIRAAVSLGIAVMLIVSVFVGYVPQPQYIKELTCISNFGLGILFLVSAVRQLRGKKEWPGLVYGCGAVTILLVFIICMVSLTGMYRMNFQGAFLFLHVINPLAVLAYYMVFVDKKRRGRARGVFLMPCAAVLYLLADYIGGKVGGAFVYGFFEPAELSFLPAVLVGAVIYLMLLAVGFAVFFVNGRLHKR